jgi:Cys-tRNA synthase (O-phospho-L-seryl-tRNA:Cys-tRNA synthase)
MDKASTEILRFWKTQWEAYMKSMMAMQGQGEAMLEMIQKSGVLQEGSQKMVKEWADKYADKYKVIQKTYLDTVEDHFKKLEDIIEL